VYLFVVGIDGEECVITEPDTKLVLEESRLHDDVDKGDTAEKQ
jgi:hypothetical protein